MAMEVNGAALLQAIAKTPSAFALDEAQINTLALTMLTGRFKDKAVGLEHIRSIVQLAGADDVKLTLDSLTAKDLAAVSKRIDPKNPDLRGASEAWHRDHIWSLADGSLQPTASASKPLPKPKTSDPKGASSKTGEVMKSKALKPKVVATTPKPRASSTRKPKQV